jgi:hypothetical protein
MEVNKGLVTATKYVIQDGLDRGEKGFSDC